MPLDFIDIDDIIRIDMDHGENNRSVEATPASEPASGGRLEAVASSAEQAFHVHDAGTANWVVKKVVQSREYAERVRRWAEREVGRAERAEKLLLERYGEQLRCWLEAELARRGGRRKSVSLPGGTVGMRWRPPQVVVEDESVVLAWARTHHPEIVRITERVLKSELNKVIEETGEVPERGVGVKPGCDHLYIK